MFNDLLEGRYIILVEANGFITTEETVFIRANRTVHHNFNLITEDQLDVTEPAASLPESISLVEAFPNPFNSMTNISINLQESQWIQVSLYDLSGRSMFTIHEGTLPVGQNQLTLDGSGLSVGSYLIKVETLTESFTKPINVVK